MPWNNNNIRYLSLVCFFIFHLQACKNKEKPNDDEPKVPTYDTPEFKDFYEKFSSDSIFQLDHTVFPLEGMKRLEDSLDEPNTDFRWQKENWVLHKPYDDMDGTFSREMLDLNGLVIERISDPSGKYSMERRFGKLSSGWHLIYYREMGMY